MGEVKSLDELREILSELKQKGEKIVFTNGCFDLIHVGHIQCLRDAKALGDVLVVAMNSDSSVEKIKPGRPIVPQEQRAEVLAALEMVDYVVIFDEETPYETIKALRPDVLVKGGDWKISEIVGADLVEEVYSLPYKTGVSTTSIIEKICKKHC